MEPTADMPSSELEEALIGIWIRALGVDRVGLHDNFFDLGGHSLLAIDVVVEIGELIGIEVLVSDLEAAPTIADLVREIARTFAERADPAALARLAAESASQERKAP